MSNKEVSSSEVMSEREKEIRKYIEDVKRVYNGEPQHHMDKDTDYLLSIIDQQRTQLAAKDVKIDELQQEVCNRNDATNRIVMDMVDLKRVTIPELESQLATANRALEGLRVKGYNHD
jgi:hypothetical protein